MKVPEWRPQTEMSSEKRTRAFSQDEAMNKFWGFQVGSDTHSRCEKGLVRLVGPVREREGVMARD